MKEFEASTQTIFCQEAHRFLSRCILTLHNGVLTLSHKEKMVEEIKSILELEAKNQNAVNVADPAVRGQLHDMGFLLANIEASLTRLQLDISEFAWVAGLVTDGLEPTRAKAQIKSILNQKGESKGLKPNQKGESKCQQNEQN